MENIKCDSPSLKGNRSEPNLRTRSEGPPESSDQPLDGVSGSPKVPENQRENWTILGVLGLERQYLVRRFRHPKVFKQAALSVEVHVLTHAGLKLRNHPEAV